MRSKLKTVLATLSLTLAFALVGSPAAPVANLVPTVGGVAYAYAPCDSLFWDVVFAAAAYARDRSDQNHEALRRAISEYFHHCSA